MREESDLIKSEINKLTSGKPSVQIKNLELLHYQAFKINEIYTMKSSNPANKSLGKNVINAERWKLLRYISIIVLYLSVILIKPGWCSKMENMKPDCTESLGLENGVIKYFVIAPFEFIDLYKFEVVSWLLMLLLIFYDLILLEVNQNLMISCCVLFVCDLISGFLFIQGIIPTKVNNLFRIMFLAIYALINQQVFSTFGFYVLKISLERPTINSVVRFHCDLCRNAVTCLFFR